MNNYERIKAMSIEEMAKFIYSIDPAYCMNCPANINCRGRECVTELAQWLKSEDDEDE